ncbi:MAG: hypothetical protein A3F84_11550 [Candidatus Handelsmanbacteria bacterium RIFCSPLOWO2_12_FULL_64_10]|uniref:histidine kinase n=1 Tax=Handelsmanbacteria sp. (strain RIFCSPLOWO2_12_FULL_64_10) TaxID=1817868 RepID=A0A1F6C6B0_HANXR|nr:MAG: hypothetical protein A3F84_11550 [Candidatus Handelsmanbacteria bacterium RIFCSPLOWO2_12_FULL_64_10]
MGLTRRLLVYGAGMLLLAFAVLEVAQHLIFGLTETFVRWHLLYVAGFILLLLGPLWCFLLRRVLRPLARLVEANRRVMAGREAESLISPEEIPDDEIGEVMRTRNETLEELRQREEKFRSLVENTSDWVWEVDASGRYVYSSPRVRDILGYEPEEIVGRTPFDLMPSEAEVRRVRALFEEAVRRRERLVVLENVVVHKDGRHVVLETSGVPILRPDGTLTGYRGIDRDITERKRLEQQLLQAQKMEAVGTLAGGIAHDFNNLLTTIIGFTQMALLEEDLNPRVRNYIARVPEQGKRAAKLISQLLTFSRKAVTEKQPMSLRSLVKETAKMLERTIPENIAIQLKMPEDVWTVNADLTQMQQVLMNLCVNASHAMPDGGELILGLENVTLDEAYCRQYVYACPGHYVCLSVRDTGVGMTPEVQGHIFEPFFTTKQAGEGTGLGLAMVYGIVKEHKGHVNVYSEVGKGSEFKVYLPAMEEEAIQQVVSTEEPPTGGTETLLLVEDEDLVLTAGREILERLGYTVLTAKDGEEALRVYRAHRGEIALVLTDMVMPKMGGQELYEALRQMDAGVKALLMSGYSLKEKVADLRAQGLKGFVQKPFGFAKLGQAVRKALDE